MLFLVFFVFSLQIISIISDTCTITAICNCVVQNNTNASGLSGNFGAANINICNQNKTSENTSLMQSALLSQNTKTTISTDVSSNPLKYTIVCEYVDLKNDSVVPFPIQPSSEKIVLQLNYTCNAPNPTPNKEHHYSTGTILVIIFFTCVFAYLGMGIAVNYFLIGARGIELIPHISFWKDFPSLVRDGVRFLQNGCKARPSELNTTSPESYDAI